MEDSKHDRQASFDILPAHNSFMSSDPLSFLTNAELCRLVRRSTGSVVRRDSAVSQDLPSPIPGRPLVEVRTAYKRREVFVHPQKDTSSHIRGTLYVLEVVLKKHGLSPTAEKVKESVDFSGASTSDSDDITIPYVCWFPSVVTEMSLAKYTVRTPVHSLQTIRRHIPSKVPKSPGSSEPQPATAPEDSSGGAAYPYMVLGTTSGQYFPPLYFHLHRFYAHGGIPEFFTCIHRYVSTEKNDKASGHPMTAPGPSGSADSPSSTLRSNLKTTPERVQDDDRKACGQDYAVSGQRFDPKLNKLAASLASLHTDSSSHLAPSSPTRSSAAEAATGPSSRRSSASSNSDKHRPHRDLGWQFLEFGAKVTKLARKTRDQLFGVDGIDSPAGEEEARRRWSSERDGVESVDDGGKGDEGKKMKKKRSFFGRRRREKKREEREEQIETMANSLRAEKQKDVVKMNRTTQEPASKPGTIGTDEGSQTGDDGGFEMISYEEVQQAQKAAALLDLPETVPSKAVTNALSTSPPSSSTLAVMAADDAETMRRAVEGKGKRRDGESPYLAVLKPLQGGYGIHDYHRGLAHDFISSHTRHSSLYAHGSPAGAPSASPDRPDPVGAEHLYDHYLDAEGRVVDPAALRRHVLFAGLTADARPTVWKFMLGIYDWKSTLEERRTILQPKLQADYATIKSQWKTLSQKQRGRFALFRERWNRIEKDVPRTDSTHPYFRPESPETDEAPNAQQTGDKETDSPSSDAYESFTPHQRSLFDVLMTYTFYNFDLGYCQGMGDLVSVLLILLDNECEAFWCFAQLMERIGQNFMISEHLQTELFLLGNLVREHDPELYNYLEEHSCSNFFFCFRWLLLLFKREFSLETSLKAPPSSDTSHNFSAVSTPSPTTATGSSTSTTHRRSDSSSGSGSGSENGSRNPDLFRLWDRLFAVEPIACMQKNAGGEVDGEDGADEELGVWHSGDTHWIIPSFHLFVMLGILRENRGKLMGENMDFDEVLSYVNSLSKGIDVDRVLSRALEEYTIRSERLDTRKVPKPAASKPPAPASTEAGNKNTDVDVKSSEKDGGNIAAGGENEGEDENPFAECEESEGNVVDDPTNVSLSLSTTAMAAFDPTSAPAQTSLSLSTPQDASTSSVSPAKPPNPTEEMDLDDIEPVTSSDSEGETRGEREREREREKEGERDGTDPTSFGAV